MCVRYMTFGPAREGWIKDTLRGRISDTSRFRRLRDYAYRRWEKTRDLRHANQWRAIMEAIDRREPK